MRIVVLASRKGGSGKTTLAGHLAGRLAVQAGLDELPGASRSARAIAQLRTYLESRLERQPRYPGMPMVPGFAAPTPPLSAFGATGA